MSKSLYRHAELQRDDIVLDRLELGGAPRTTTASAGAPPRRPSRCKCGDPCRCCGGAEAGGQCLKDMNQPQHRIASTNPDRSEWAECIIYGAGWGGMVWRNT